MLLCEDTLTPAAAPAARPRNLAVNAAIALLAETWPLCFAIYERRRQPLKVGIRSDILAALDGAATPEELGAALRSYTGNPHYLRAMFIGAPRPRIDLDGNPYGEVTAEQAAAAAAKLAGYAAARRRHMAAAPAPAAAIPTPAPSAAPSSPISALVLPTPQAPQPR
jgi:ProP effector